MRSFGFEFHPCSPPMDQSSVRSSYLRPWTNTPSATATIVSSSKREKKRPSGAMAMVTAGNNPRHDPNDNLKLAWYFARRTVIRTAEDWKLGCFGESCSSSKEPNQMSTARVLRYVQPCATDKSAQTPSAIGLVNVPLLMSWDSGSQSGKRSPLRLKEKEMLTTF